MTNALESGHKPTTIRRNAGPNRFERTPKPLLTLTEDTIERDVLAIIRAIKDYRRRFGCGSYLFIEPTMTVYVITEDQSAAQDWIRSRFAQLVGLYCPVPHQRGLSAPLGVAEGLTCTYEGIVEDVREHLESLLRRVLA